MHLLIVVLIAALLLPVFASIKDSTDSVRHHDHPPPRTPR